MDKLQIKNFKSHSNTTIDLGNMNILTGMNGMGKSSVIQSLLLLRQTYSKGMLGYGLELNGELCSIGTANDAMYRYAEDSDLIEFLINAQHSSFHYGFRVDASNIAKTFLEGKNEIGKDSELSLFSNGFQYISAFRNGPMNDYIKDSAAVELLGQISRIEGRGELVAHYYDHYKTDEVHPYLIEDEQIGTSVQAQVEYWMREISPNINIDIQSIGNSFKLNYSFNRGKGTVKTDPFLSTNIGFGVSYVLPIVLSAIVACSKKKVAEHFDCKNKLILIENPEAHIHPNAQANLMKLLCKAANLGVQFIIETHSDHIINSILVANKNNLLGNDLIKIYYFTREENKHLTITEQLPIEKGGRIKNPPKGFFDQIDIHMRQLMGF